MNYDFARDRILEKFLAEGHDPCYGSCSYWGDDKRGYNDTILSPYGHGWHLDRKRFNLFLAKQAQQNGVIVETNANFNKGEALENESYQINYTQNDN